jgi:predicted nucleotidyltransferase
MNELDNQNELYNEPEVEVTNVQDPTNVQEPTKEEFFNFIMSLKEVQDNLDKINYILLTGSRSVGIEKPESDYDIVLSLNDIRDNFPIYKNFNNKPIEMFFNRKNFLTFNHYLSEFLYYKNPSNLIYKKEDYVFSYDSKNIKKMYEQIQDLFKIENNTIVSYKKSAKVTYILLYYFYLTLQDKQEFLIDFNDIKQEEKNKWLKDEQVLTYLNNMNIYINSLED